MITDLLPSLIDALFYAIITPVVVASLYSMYLNIPEGRTTTMNIPASKLKTGDTIKLKDGSIANISKIKTTDVKIPARVEKSIVLMVKLSNGDSQEYAIGTSNVQMWGFEKVTKIVEPGFWSKFRAFLRSL